jgi:hypothetical protein
MLAAIQEVPLPDTSGEERVDLDVHWTSPKGLVMVLVVVTGLLLLLRVKAPSAGGVMRREEMRRGGVHQVGVFVA